jgi:hypothetical protein
MIDTMPKKTSRQKTKATQENDSPGIWKLFTKIDGALKEPFEAYLASLEYDVDQARVIERAFKEFLEKRGYWPPKETS